MTDTPPPFASPTLIIQVKEGRYDAFGPATPVGTFLMSVIEELGGINESVEDGFYHFRVWKDENGRIQASLTRFEE